MRAFFPFILLYAVLMAVIITAIFHSAVPWRDPRFGAVASRIIMYPAILMSATLTGFMALSWLIDQGIAWLSTLVIPLLAIFGVVALLKLTLVMVKDVSKSLQKKDTAS